MVFEKRHLYESKFTICRSTERDKQRKSSWHHRRNLNRAAKINTGGGFYSCRCAGWILIPIKDLEKLQRELVASFFDKRIVLAGPLWQLL